MTNPHTKTAAATFLIDRMRDLKHRKSQKEIAQEAGFLNANIGVCQTSCPPISGTQAELPPKNRTVTEATI